MKSNTIITAGEILELAKIPNWEKRLGKEAARISGIRGITSADKLIKIAGKADIDVILGEDTGTVTIKGKEKIIVHTGKALKVRKAK